MTSGGMMCGECAPHLCRPSFLPESSWLDGKEPGMIYR
jgi:hypothetical protein